MRLRTKVTKGPGSKAAGLAALALLVNPDEPQGVHAIARQIGRSPGRVSEILSELRAQGLVGADNRPFVPELFWAAVEEWKPRWYPMPKAPPPDPPDRFRLSGTLGAISLGVPVAAGPAGAWPRLYVADDTEVATVVGAYGAPSGWTGSEIAMCPSRYGFTLPSRRVGMASWWPVASSSPSISPKTELVAERYSKAGIPRS